MPLCHASGACHCATCCWASRHGLGQRLRRHALTPLYQAPPESMPSLWPTRSHIGCLCGQVRNVQLCLFSIPLQFFAVYQRDWHKVQKRGWMHGFCPSTWAVVCMFAFGGLLVAIVIRFADNNLKNLAMALAILLSCLASVRLFGLDPLPTPCGLDAMCL